MKCPLCNSEIDKARIVWHMEKIHNENIKTMLGILFNEISDLKERYNYKFGSFNYKDDNNKDTQPGNPVDLAIKTPSP